MDIRSITGGLFLVLLFLVVALPTGSIFGLNVKVLAFAVLAGTVMLFVFASPRGLSHGDVVFLTSVGGALVFWALIAVLNGESDTEQIVDQFRNLSSAIFIAWLSAFVTRRGLVRPESLIATVIYGIFSLSLLKLGLVAGTLLFNIDAVEVTRAAFGAESLVPGQISFGLLRMQFSADVLGPFALFALLARSVSGIRLGRLPSAIILVVVLGSGFLAYSRYVWFLYFVSIFAALIVERSWLAMTVTLCAVLITGAMFYEVFNTIFEARFLSDEADVSDVGRVEQARALMGEIKARPILGKGMGTHVNTNTSSVLHPYGYELQWLAYLMQFGIVGEAGVLLLVAISASDLLATRHPAKPFIFLLFLLWLLASWTNPYLTSSFAGATFGLFMTMFRNMRSQSATHSTTPSMAMEPLQS